MERREVASQLNASGKPLAKPDNAMHFLHDNCSSLAELRTRLRIVAEHIVGTRPNDESPLNEAVRAVTVLSRLEDQSFLINECFDELNRIERGLGVKGEGAAGQGR